MTAISSVEPEKLHGEFSVEPVNAVRFHDESGTLYVGRGPYLYVYVNKGEFELHEAPKVLDRERIHGISACGGAVAVVGGHSFAVYRNGEVTLNSTNEWLVSCLLLGNNLYLLTAHNEVIQVDVAGKHRQVNRVNCGERGLLYSGAICSTKRGLLVAAGTVMHGVIVWDLSGNITHRLTHHEGSIFGVQIDDTGNYLASCSDDRSVKLYSLEQGHLMGSGFGHGSRIWSLKFVSPTTIMTTGEDCTCRFWEYTNGELVQTRKWESLHNGKHIWAADVSTQSGWVVTGGADGRIAAHDLDESIVKLYQCAEPRFKTIACLNGVYMGVTKEGDIHKFTGTWAPCGVSCPGTVSAHSFKTQFHFVTQEGHILTLDDSASWTHHEAKVKVINALSWKDESSFYILLHCADPRLPFILKIWNNGAFSSTEIGRPDPKAFTPTSMYVNTEKQWLFVGSRHANLAAYDLSTSTCTLIRKICGGDTITSIGYLHSDTDSLYIWITLRDSEYIYAKVSFHESFSFEKVLQNKVSRGFIEGAFLYKNPATQKLCFYLYGFRSSAFYVWNETTQYEVANIECGGAHREWLFENTSQKRLQFAFSYLKKGSMCLTEFKSRAQEVLEEGTHGREIRDLAICPQLSSGKRLMVSVSEDAAVKLGEILGTKYTNLLTLNSHISGLQRVKFISDSLFATCAANGELLMWRITRLPLIAAVEVDRIESANADLRVMDVAHIYENGHWIAVVFSNSTVKLFRFDQKFECVAETLYSDICILHVDFVALGEKTYVMIATTDGCLTFWEVSLQKPVFGEPVLSTKLHQNAIKAVALVPKENACTIVTGGDDNALVLSELRPGPSLSVLDRKDGASSTITSLSVAGNVLLATSADQIVRIWSIDKTLECLSANYTSVADTGCSDVFRDTDLYGIVGGAGLGVFRILQ